MGRIKRWMQAQVGSVAHIYVQYAVTVIFALLAALVMVLDNQTDLFSYEIGSAVTSAATWIVFFLLCAVGSLLTETVYSQKNKNNLWKMAAGYGGGMTIAAVYSFGIISFLNDSQQVAGLILENALTWYALSLIGVSLFFVLKRTDISVHEYIGRVVFGLLRLFAIVLVLNLAVFLILFLIDILLFTIPYDEFMENLEIILCAVLYFPFALSSVADAREENKSFTKKFVLYALFPCVLAAMLIVYLYIIKIFITDSVPKNEIFDICGCLFLCGMPVWMMAYAFAKKREGIYFFLIKNMKYIYAPLICLEGYALGVRIAQLGLTERRCMGILFMVMQILYIAWKREKYRNLIFVSIGLAFFAFVLPISSVSYLSYISQKSIMKEQSARGASAFYYLKDNVYGEQYLKERYTKEELLTLQEDYDSYGEEDSSHEIYISFYENALQSGITFGEGYGGICSFGVTVKDAEGDQGVLLCEEDAEFATVITAADVRACVEYYYELYQRRESGASVSDEDEIYETTLADGQKLIVDQINYSCDALTGSLKSSVRMTGYLIQ